MDDRKQTVNPDKTEYLLFNSKDINVPVSININSNILSPSESAKILSVIYHSDMFMDKNILSVVKTCSLQRREFRHIRSFILKSAAITFANAFIHSSIDCCNSLAFYMVFQRILFIAYKNYKTGARARRPYFSFVTHYFHSQIFTLVTC